MPRRRADVVSQLPQDTDRFICSVTHERADLPPSPAFATLGEDLRRTREDINPELVDEEA
jgi:hypothetical protein